MSPADRFNLRRPLQIVRRTAVVFIMSLPWVFSPASSYGDSAEGIRSQLDEAGYHRDRESMIELLRRLIDIEPANQDARERLLSLWIAERDCDMARRAVDEWPQAPERLRVRTLARIACFGDKCPQKAVDILRPWIERNPEDRDALVDFAGYLALTGSWKEEISILDRAIAIRKGAGLLMARAVAERALGNFPEAVSDARASKAIGVTRQLPEFERLEEVLPAIQEETAVLDKDPGNLRSLLTIGSLWHYASLDERALGAAEAALKADPDSAYGRILKARSLHALGKITAAKALEEYGVDPGTAGESQNVIPGIISLDVALNKSPGNADLLVRRARALNEAGPGTSGLALADAKAAAGKMPASPLPQIEMIAAYAAAGRKYEALHAFRELRSARPSSKQLAEAQRMIAAMELEQGEQDIAASYAEKSIRLDPRAETYRILASVLQRQGLVKDAKAASDKADELERRGGR